MNPVRKRGRRVAAATACAEILERRTLLSVTLGSNYTGMHYPDSGGFVPPDTNAATGPNQVVEVVNNTISFYDKSAGTRLFQQQLHDFFSPVGAGPELALTDPVVKYDELAGRFVVQVLEISEATQQAYIDFAVSDTSDPRGGFSKMQRLNITETDSVGRSYFGDFDKLGYNADAWVLTANMYSFGSVEAFDHVQVIAINKSTFAANKVDRPSSRHVPTMEPAAMHGATPGSPMYFVEEPQIGSVDIVRMDNVLSAAPTFTDTTLTVPTYTIPPNAPQPSGTSITTNESDILSAAWRNNRLVATQCVGTNSAAHARWYEFNTTVAPALTQEGEINPGAGVYTYYPSIDIAADGDLGMTYMESSSTEFMSMYVTGQKVTDPQDTMETPVLAKAGEANYATLDTIDASPYRAGDYSGINADPVDGTSFWASNEYASTDANANWGTWIANFTLQAAKTAASYSFWDPTTVPATVSNVAGGAVELGLRFRTDVGGYVTGVRFYKGPRNVGTHVGNVWSAAGQLLGSVTFAGETATGWQQMNFSNPVPLMADTYYIISYHTDAGRFSDTIGYFATSGADSGPLHAPADGISGANGVYVWGASAFPTLTYQSTNYFVDTVFAPDTTPPTVTAQNPPPGAKDVSANTTVTATFSKSVQPASIRFTVQDGFGTAVPGTVTYNDSTRTATFTPAAPLGSAQTYTATVSDATDLVGNVMASAVSSSFTTADTTPPTVTAQSPSPGATAVLINTAVTATFSESIQPATLSFVLTDAANNAVQATVNYNDATHTATLTPSPILANSTVYTATVSSAADVSGNIMTSPATWSFTTSARMTWTQTSSADFTAGVLAGTVITNTSGGEVRLARSFDDFSGTALSSTWMVTPWQQPGGPAHVSVSASVLSVAGAQVTAAAVPAGTSFEASVSIGAAAREIFGLATGLAQTAGNSWAVFSTKNSTNTLFARVNNNGTTQDVNLGALPTGFHLYRIQPTASGFAFYLDGMLKTTINATLPAGAMLKPVFSSFSGSAPPLLVDSVTYGAYAASGTLLSSVFDSGKASVWGSASWTANMPAGTTLIVETRSGSTATPDPSWSNWQAVTNGGTVASPAARYLQYRLTLASTAAASTPELDDITFVWS